ncbi:hypothetical protein C0992_005467 [Termitomyces sp. T32_za158]|nr:hypothetical protein C0992_005467 [Termitomyces sp. T32_za158]
MDSSDILLNADPTILHWIEFVAGTSNDIILSQGGAALAKFMLQVAEQSLVANKTSLETNLRVERLRVALAPHKIVPTEILIIIFQYATTTSIRFGYDPPLTHELLIFSHVCSRWRTICRSELPSWNRAAFAIRDTRDYATRVKFWIDNLVVNSPQLSLLIHWGGSDFGYESLQLLLSQHKRIRCLDLDYLSDIEPFLEIPMHSFPILEDLKIATCLNDWLLFKRASCFVGMANLRNLTVDSHFNRSNSMFTQATIPWGHLTSLSIYSDHLTLSQAVVLLKQCTNLRKCSIRVKNKKCRISALHASTLSRLTVHLPHLTDLYFARHRYSDDHNLSLMHCLVAPVLKSLTIDLLNRKKSRTPYVNPDIGHVFRHAGPSLHRLKLRGFGVIMKDTDLELELLPCLHTLIAPDTVFSNETLRKIVQEILLPNIQTLIIAIHSIDSLEYVATLAERKSSSLPTRFLIVAVLEKYGDSIPDHSYIEACSKRIEACGTTFALHFRDYWVSEVVTCGISSLRFEEYFAEAY